LPQGVPESFILKVKIELETARLRAVEWLTEEGIAVAPSNLEPLFREILPEAESPPAS